MKRVVLVAAAFVFAVGVVAISMVSEVGGSLAWADEAGLEESKETGQAVEAQLIKEGKVDYYLPYPGILPDHPLYWLKMVRDRVLLWLAREPMAKTERLLLYADKRIGAAKALTEGNQPELAITTAAKAEKYLEQVLEETKRLSLSEGEQDQWLGRLDKAYQKHIEVLSGVVGRVPDQAREVVEEILRITKEGNERVKEMKRIEVGAEIEGEEVTEATELEGAL